MVGGSEMTHVNLEKQPHLHHQHRQPAVVIARRSSADDDDSQSRRQFVCVFCTRNSHICDPLRACYPAVRNSEPATPPPGTQSLLPRRQELRACYPAVRNSEPATPPSGISSPVTTHGCGADMVSSSRDCRSIRHGLHTATMTN